MLVLLAAVAAVASGQTGPASPDHNKRGKLALLRDHIKRLTEVIRAMKNYQRSADSLRRVRIVVGRLRRRGHG
jgi:hypothetical protein